MKIAGLGAHGIPAGGGAKPAVTAKGPETKRGQGASEANVRDTFERPPLVGQDAGLFAARPAVPGTANVEINSESWDLKKQGARQEVGTAKAEMYKQDAEQDREEKADLVKNAIDTIKQLMSIDSQAKSKAINSRRS